MPPKTKYTVDHVLEAALQVVRNEGLTRVSARTVAQELGSSTAPISSAFDNMQALNDAILEAIIAQLLAAIGANESSKDDPVRRAAFAIAKFTADNPRFYEALFLHPHQNPPDWAALRTSFSRPLGDSERYAKLSPKERDALAWRASVVTHGICIEIWSERWTKTTDRALWRLVDQLVEPIIESALNG